MSVNMNDSDVCSSFRCRSIDFHERNNWAIIWVALTANDEAMVYREMSPSPMKMITDDICDRIADESNGESYKFNLIDPLANKNQVKSRTSALDDINKRFRWLASVGRSSRSVWEPFNTKGTHGREAIRTRLYNSLQCEKPGNNIKVVGGHEVTLPTLWISQECPMTSMSLKSWRYEEWTGQSSSYKDRKESPIQKYSHFCTALEGIMKDIRFKVPKARSQYVPPSMFKRGR